MEKLVILSVIKHPLSLGLRPDESEPGEAMIQNSVRVRDRPSGVPVVIDPMGFQHLQQPQQPIRM